MLFPRGAAGVLLDVHEHQQKLGNGLQANEVDDAAEWLLQYEQDLLEHISKSKALHKPARIRQYECGCRDQQLQGVDHKNNP
jgi:hypothetical protein